ncbi:hypothetical protein PHYPSEUDO_005911 [Phytophthora pseudosyringae]|uniref:RxLR effector protein n=1 Tax=Phytophthora pseudosyringae TaxID=221518 RepID=A0A8T1VKD0_9STRA|nr:hypothetical protein PHYPSEUDO_005911 [Phytophthora pseudosyringae]
MLLCASVMLVLAGWLALQPAVGGMAKARVVVVPAVGNNSLGKDEVLTQHYLDWNRFWESSMLRQTERHALSSHKHACVHGSTRRGDSRYRRFPLATSEVNEK